MSPSRPFILRPVATSLLMTAIFLVGVVAYTQLPVSALPQALVRELLEEKSAIDVQIRMRFAPTERDLRLERGICNRFNATWHFTTQRAKTYRRWPTSY